MYTRRWAGTAASAVLMLMAATALVVGGGVPGVSAVRPSADTVAETVSDTLPSSGTIEIVPSSGGFGWMFAPANQSLAVGGSLSVHNSTEIPHTFTSVAQGGNGPLFNVKVLPGETVAVPAVSTLSDGTYAYFCRFHTTMTGTLTIGAGGPVTQDPPFEQPLVQPPRLTGKHIRIVMKRARVRVLPHGSLTPMLTFGGTFPGPTIVRRAGQDTKVTFVNRLPKKYGAVTIHQHAGHQSSADDGQPASHLIRHGRQRTYDYPLRDDGSPLPAALRFYHDHRMDKTARNNWLGLQGMFLTTDPRDAKMGLPHGRYDIPLAITDRSFRSDNRLTNPFASMSGMGGGPGMETVGDRVLVNGRYAPYKRVRPGLYRLRLFNSSLFSSYDFALSNGLPFKQIGTGSGLLPRPVVRQDILLGPAQRADVVIDLRKYGGQNVELQSILPTEGASSGVGLMQFRVRGKQAPTFRVPSTLARIQHYKVPTKISKIWRFGLSSTNHWTINGKRFDPSRVDLRVPLGSTERWKLVNDSPFTHLVHLHEELWRTLERDGHSPPPWERGYEDTWRLDPGETVVVAARFTDFTGKFMIHCHMLDHEDDGMMATWEVVKPKRR